MCYINQLIIITMVCIFKTVTKKKKVEHWNTRSPSTDLGSVSAFDTEYSKTRLRLGKLTLDWFLEIESIHSLVFSSHRGEIIVLRGVLCQGRWGLGGGGALENSRIPVQQEPLMQFLPRLLSY